MFICLDGRHAKDNRSMVEVITGQKSVSAYMEEFGSMWKQYGGDKLIEETKPLAEDIEKMLGEVSVESN